MKMLCALLLSLGLGRGPAPFETDRRLQAIRDFLAKPLSSIRNPRFFDPPADWEAGLLRARALLAETVAQFDQSPLSLREQSRNAVSHALGGVRFQSRALHLPLPTSLEQFVIVPASRTRALFPTRFP